MSTAITLRDLYHARQTIAPFIRQTPLIRSHELSRRTGKAIYLKLENQQETGSFKLRGAANRLCNLPDDARKRGVVTVSTGNHGRGVAYMAQQLGIRAVICVPGLVLPHKIAAMQALGAEVVVHGAIQDEAEAHALTLQANQGLTLISAFDDLDIIAGQGTIGLEILEALPQVATVVVPLSGGGLLGGIGVAMKGADPAIQTVGVSQELGPAMVLSLQAGRPTPVIEEPSLADSLLGSIGLENRHTFDLIRQVVDRFVLVSEAEIGAAMVHALKVERQVVEGGGSVGLAALLADKLPMLGDPAVIVVSGGNVEMDKLLKLTAK